MGRKYFVHPAAVVVDGKEFCCYCGRELPGTLKADFPCTVSPPIPFDEDVTVSVWNCRVKVFYKDVDVASICDEEEKKRLEELALDSVYASGGAINWSGIYPPSEELCKFVEELVKKKGIA